MVLTGFLFTACDSCDSENTGNKNPQTENEVDLSGMWSDEDWDKIKIRVGNPEDFNEDDYTDWVD